MSTVGWRTGGFEKRGHINRKGKQEGKHFWGVILMYAKVLVVYDKYLLYYCLQIISLHWNTLIYAL